MAKPRILVIGTGGTIASVGAGSLDVLDYPDYGTRLEMAAVLARVPEVERFATVRAVDYRAVPSSAIGPADWLALARLVAAHAGDADGFVITHGTSTLEETAYFLDLVLTIPQPVVLVGAQRPISAVGSDAPMNLVAAVRTAAAPTASGLGVLVVLNDEIHAAREVSKTSTYRVQTFRTPDFGALGQVDGDGVQIYRHPVHRQAGGFDVAALAALPRVDIAYSYAGADGAAIDAFVAAGAAGIVSAGFAPGLTAPDELAALRRARKAGVLVVQSSRVGSGRIAPRRFLRAEGFIGADNLTPQKARILLALALTRTRELAAIEAMFATR